MNLVIRADASSAIGTGHVMRCLALAQFWRRMRGEVCFVFAQHTPAVRSRMDQEDIQVRSNDARPGSQTDAEFTSRIARDLKASAIVVDGYHFEPEYHEQLRHSGIPVAYLDDFGHASRYVAEFVINQNVSATRDLYRRVASHTCLLLGPEYVLLRQEYARWRQWKRTIPRTASRILVTFGGSDPAGMTKVAIDGLKEIWGGELEAVIVAGGSNDHGEAIRADVEGVSRMSYRRDVQDMSALMAWADIGVAGAGTTASEMAYMGLPTILVAVAENQASIAEYMGRFGLARSLGRREHVSPSQISTVLRELIAAEDERKEMCRRGRGLIDGRGGERIVSKIERNVVVEP